MKQGSDLLKRIKKYRICYAMMLPFIVVFFVFTVFPVIASVILSFSRYNVFEAPVFIGLTNYTNLFFADDIFSTAMKNTVIFGLITGPVGYFMCFFLSWMINELPHRARSLFTLAFYLPSIAGNVFAIWLIVFDGDIYGYLNSILLKLGFLNEPQQWLTDPKYMMAAVIVVQLWMGMGTSFLTMRAGFGTVGRQYYEAAAVDGVGNRFQELWYITIPMMVPHLMLSAILSITAAFNSFNVATVLTGFPSTNYATHTIVHHMMDYAYIRYDRGYACAIATLLFLGCYVLNIFIQRGLRKVGK